MAEYYNGNRKRLMREQQSSDDDNDSNNELNNNVQNAVFEQRQQQYLQQQQQQAQLLLIEQQRQQQQQRQQLENASDMEDNADYNSAMGEDYSDSPDEDNKSVVSHGNQEFHNRAKNQHVRRLNSSSYSGSSSSEDKRLSKSHSRSRSRTQSRSGSSSKAGSNHASLESITSSGSDPESEPTGPANQHLRPINRLRPRLLPENHTFMKKKLSQNSNSSDSESASDASTPRHRKRYTRHISRKNKQQQQQQQQINETHEFSTTAGSVALSPLHMTKERQAFERLHIDEPMKNIHPARRISGYSSISSAGGSESESEGNVGKHWHRSENIRLDLRVHSTKKSSSSDSSNSTDNEKGLRPTSQNSTSSSTHSIAQHEKQILPLHARNNDSSSSVSDGGSTPRTRHLTPPNTAYRDVKFICDSPASVNSRNSQHEEIPRHAQEIPNLLQNDLPTETVHNNEENLLILKPKQRYSDGSIDVCTRRLMQQFNQNRFSEGAIKVVTAEIQQHAEIEQIQEMEPNDADNTRIFVDNAQYQQYVQQLTQVQELEQQIQQLQQNGQPIDPQLIECLQQQAEELQRTELLFHLQHEQQRLRNEEHQNSDDISNADLHAFSRETSSNCSFSQLDLSPPEYERYMREVAEITRIPTKCRATKEDKVNLADFLIKRVLGCGAYGKVYLVQKKGGDDDKKLYAMKVLKKESVCLKTKTAEHTSTERLVLEAVGSDNPFLVSMHYAFQSESKLYMVLDYVPGGELFSYLYNSQHFSEDIVRIYIAEVIIALEHLHKLGIAYRDIKLENILLDHTGHIVITDYGLSKIFKPGGFDRTDSFCGTLEYMAPEILNKSPVGHDMSVDWWSVGVLTFELLAGASPFAVVHPAQANQADIARKIAVWDNSQIPSTFSDDARDFISKLLDKNPETRLGGNGREATEIKRHHFFKGINWRDLRKKRRLSTNHSESCDDEVDARTLRAGETDPEKSARIGAATKNFKLFRGFSYVAPEHLKNKEIKTDQFFQHHVEYCNPPMINPPEWPTNLVVGEMHSSGAFGELFLVHEDSNPDLKFIAKAITEDKYRPSEVDALTSLNRMQNFTVCQYIKTFRHENEIRILMEYLPGAELALCIGAGLTELLCLELFSQILDGVAHIHNNRFVHGDIKPENIVFSDIKMTCVKIVDFGNATYASDEAFWYDAPRYTLDYAPPEALQHPDYAIYSFAFDIWCLGATLYRMFMGHPPFRKNRDDVDVGDEEMHARIRSGQFYKEEPRWLEASAALQDLITRCLNVQFEKRITLLDVLRHPWIQQTDEDFEEPPMPEIPTTEQSQHNVQPMQIDVESERVENDIARSKKVVAGASQSHRTIEHEVHSNMMAVEERADRIVDNIDLTNCDEQEAPNEHNDKFENQIDEQRRQSTDVVLKKKPRNSAFRKAAKASLRKFSKQYFNVSSDYDEALNESSENSEPGDSSRRNSTMSPIRFEESLSDSEDTSGGNEKFVVQREEDLTSKTDSREQLEQTKMQQQNNENNYLPQQQRTTNEHVMCLSPISDVEDESLLIGSNNNVPTEQQSCNFKQYSQVQSEENETEQETTENVPAISLGADERLFLGYDDEEDGAETTTKKYFSQFSQENQLAKKIDKHYATDQLLSIYSRENSLSEFIQMRASSPVNKTTLNDETGYIDTLLTMKSHHDAAAVSTKSNNLESSKTDNVIEAEQEEQSKHSSDAHNLENLNEATTNTNSGDSLKNNLVTSTPKKFDEESSTDVSCVPEKLSYSAFREAAKASLRKCSKNYSNVSSDFDEAANESSEDSECDSDILRNSKISPIDAFESLSNSVSSYKEPESSKTKISTKEECVPAEMKIKHEKPAEYIPRQLIDEFILVSDSDSIPDEQINFKTASEIPCSPDNLTLSSEPSQCNSNNAFQTEYENKTSTNFEKAKSSENAGKPSTLNFADYEDISMPEQEDLAVLPAYKEPSPEPETEEREEQDSAVISTTIRKDIYMENQMVVYREVIEIHTNVHSNADGIASLQRILQNQMPHFGSNMYRNDFRDNSYFYSERPSHSKHAQPQQEQEEEAMSDDEEEKFEAKCNTDDIETIVLDDSNDAKYEINNDDPVKFVPTLRKKNTVICISDDSDEEKPSTAHIQTDAEVPIKEENRRNNDSKINVENRTNQPKYENFADNLYPRRRDFERHRSKEARFPNVKTEDVKPEVNNSGSRQRFSNGRRSNNNNRRFYRRNASRPMCQCQHNAMNENRVIEISDEDDVEEVEIKYDTSTKIEDEEDDDQKFENMEIYHKEEEDPTTNQSYGSELVKNELEEQMNAMFHSPNSSWRENSTTETKQEDEEETQNDMHVAETGQENICENDVKEEVVVNEDHILNNSSEVDFKPLTEELNNETEMQAEKSEDIIKDIELGEENSVHEVSEIDEIQQEMEEKQPTPCHEENQNIVKETNSTKQTTNQHTSDSNKEDIENNEVSMIISPINEKALTDVEETINIAEKHQDEGERDEELKENIHMESEVNVSADASSCDIYEIEESEESISQQLAELHEDSPERIEKEQSEELQEQFEEEEQEVRQEEIEEEKQTELQEPIAEEKQAELQEEFEEEDQEDIQRRIEEELQEQFDEEEQAELQARIAQEKQAELQEELAEEEQEELQKRIEEELQEQFDEEEQVMPQERIEEEEQMELEQIEEGKQAELPEQFEEEEQAELEEQLDEEKQAELQQQIEEEEHAELEEEKQAELQQQIEEELRDELQQQIDEEGQAELQEQIVEEAQAVHEEQFVEDNQTQLQEQIEEELQEELRQQIEEEEQAEHEEQIVEEVQAEYEEQFVEDNQAVLQEQIEEELQEELQQQIEEELQEELQQQIEEEEQTELEEDNQAELQQQIEKELQEELQQQIEEVEQAELEEEIVEEEQLELEEQMEVDDEEVELQQHIEEEQQEVLQEQCEEEEQAELEEEIVEDEQEELQELVEPDEQEELQEQVEEDEQEELQDNNSDVPTENLDESAKFDLEKSIDDINGEFEHDSKELSNDPLDLGQTNQTYFEDLSDTETDEEQNQLIVEEYADEIDEEESFNSACEELTVIDECEVQSSTLEPASADVSATETYSQQSELEEQECSHIETNFADSEENLTEIIVESTKPAEQELDKTQQTAVEDDLEEMSISKEFEVSQVEEQHATECTEESNHENYIEVAAVPQVENQSVDKIKEKSVSSNIFPVFEDISDEELTEDGINENMSIDKGMLETVKANDSNRNMVENVNNKDLPITLLLNENFHAVPKENIPKYAEKETLNASAIETALVLEENLNEILDENSQQEILTKEQQKSFESADLQTSLINNNIEEAEMVIPAEDSHTIENSNVKSPADSSYESIGDKYDEERSLNNDGVNKLTDQINSSCEKDANDTYEGDNIKINEPDQTESEITLDNKQDNTEFSDLTETKQPIEVKQTESIDESKQQEFHKKILGPEETYTLEDLGSEDTLIEAEIINRIETTNQTSLCRRIGNVNEDEQVIKNRQALEEQEMLENYDIAEEEVIVETTIEDDESALRISEIPEKDTNSMQQIKTKLKEELKIISNILINEPKEKIVQNEIPKKVEKSKTVVSPAKEISKTISAEAEKFSVIVNRPDDEIVQNLKENELVTEIEKITDDDDAIVVNKNEKVVDEVDDEERVEIAVEEDESASRNSAFGIQKEQKSTVTSISNNDESISNTTLSDSISTITDESLDEVTKIFMKNSFDIEPSCEALNALNVADSENQHKQNEILKSKTIAEKSKIDIPTNSKEAKRDVPVVTNIVDFPSTHILLDYAATAAKTAIPTIAPIVYKQPVTDDIMTPYLVVPQRDQNGKIVAVVHTVPKPVVLSTPTVQKTPTIELLPMENQVVVKYDTLSTDAASEITILPVPQVVNEQQPSVVTVILKNSNEAEQRQEKPAPARNAAIPSMKTSTSTSSSSSSLNNGINFFDKMKMKQANGPQMPLEKKVDPQSITTTKLFKNSPINKRAEKDKDLLDFSTIARATRFGESVQKRSLHNSSMSKRWNTFQRHWTHREEAIEQYSSDTDSQDDELEEGEALKEAENLTKINSIFDYKNASKKLPFTATIQQNSAKLQRENKNKARFDLATNFKDKGLWPDAEIQRLKEKLRIEHQQMKLSRQQIKQQQLMLSRQLKELDNLSRIQHEQKFSAHKNETISELQHSIIASLSKANSIEDLTRERSRKTFVLQPPKVKADCIKPIEQSDFNKSMESDFIEFERKIVMPIHEKFKDIIPTPDAGTSIKMFVTPAPDKVKKPTAQAAAPSRQAPAPAPAPVPIVIVPTKEIKIGTDNLLPRKIKTIERSSSVPPLTTNMCNNILNDNDKCLSSPSDLSKEYRRADNYRLKLTNMHDKGFYLINGKYIKNSLTVDAQRKRWQGKRNFKNKTRKVDIKQTQTDIPLAEETPVKKMTSSSYAQTVAEELNTNDITHYYYPCTPERPKKAKPLQIISLHLIEGDKISKKDILPNGQTVKDVQQLDNHITPAYQNANQSQTVESHKPDILDEALKLHGKNDGPGPPFIREDSRLLMILYLSGRRMLIDPKKILDADKARGTKDLVLVADGKILSIPEEKLTEILRQAQLLHKMNELSEKLSYMEHGKKENKVNRKELRRLELEKLRMEKLAVEMEKKREKDEQKRIEDERKKEERKKKELEKLERKRLREEKKLLLQKQRQEERERKAELRKEKQRQRAELKKIDGLAKKNARRARKEETKRLQDELILAEMKRIESLRNKETPIITVIDYGTTADEEYHEYVEEQNTQCDIGPNDVTLIEPAQPPTIDLLSACTSRASTPSAAQMANKTTKLTLANKLKLLENLTPTELGKQLEELYASDELVEVMYVKGSSSETEEDRKPKILQSYPPLKIPIEMPCFVPYEVNEPVHPKYRRYKSVNVRRRSADSINSNESGGAVDRFIGLKSYDISRLHCFTNIDSRKINRRINLLKQAAAHFHKEKQCLAELNKSTNTENISNLAETLIAMSNGISSNEKCTNNAENIPIIKNRRIFTKPLELQNFDLAQNLTLPEEVIELWEKEANEKKLTTELRKVEREQKDKIKQLKKLGIIVTPKRQNTTKRASTGKKNQNSANEDAATQTNGGVKRKRKNCNTSDKEPANKTSKTTDGTVKKRGRKPTKAKEKEQEQVQVQVEEQELKTGEEQQTEAAEDLNVNGKRKRLNTMPTSEQQTEQLSENLAEEVVFPSTSKKRRRTDDEGGRRQPRQRQKPRRFDE